MTARIVVLAVWFWAGWLAPVLAENVAWDRLTTGLSAAVWAPGSSCGDQVPPLYLVQADPDHVRFEIHHFRHDGLAEPPTMPEWQQRLHAGVLFNAGLFKEDYAYLGLLYHDGRSLGGKRHPQWQGLFVAEPTTPAGPRARVLDLSSDPFAEAQPSYREAAQSIMLLDRERNPRVRRSGKWAHQTIVGEDVQGHILIIKTTAPATLRDLAECLRDQMPSLRHAMAMDGGSSSDLLIGRDLARSSSGAEKPWQPLVDGGHVPHIPLPAVIGVFARK